MYEKSFYLGGTRSIMPSDCALRYGKNTAIAASKAVLFDKKASKYGKNPAAAVALPDLARGNDGL